MRNYRLTLAYDGTSYSGWQVQKNAKTIQRELEKALIKILKEKTRAIGSGRTDSGVHARAQVASFKTSKSIPAEALGKALNAKLPPDVSVTEVKKVSQDFHAQYSARGKLYRYTISNSSLDCPFSRKYYWKVAHPLDVGLMAKEAKVLRGKHDFRSFRSKSQMENTVRTVKNIEVKKKRRSLIEIDIEADGFLYNMARSIVGTLVEIGRGYFPEGSMEKILMAKDRKKAGPTAPAKGLMLVKVKY
jgi:tRNA pseudouridine38-40 synthase